MEPVAAKNYQISSMRRLKVVKSCYQNHYFTKIENQFFPNNDGIIPACCILKGCRGACICTKSSNELDEVVKSGQIMLPKPLFYKNRKTIFFNIMMAYSSLLLPEGLLWAPTAVQNHFKTTDSTTDSIFQEPIPQPIPFSNHRFRFRFHFGRFHRYRFHYRFHFPTTDSDFNSTLSDSTDTDSTTDSIFQPPIPLPIPLLAIPPIPIPPPIPISNHRFRLRFHFGRFHRFRILPS